MHLMLVGSRDLVRTNCGVVDRYEEIFSRSSQWFEVDPSGEPASARREGHEDARDL